MDQKKQQRKLTGIVIRDKMNKTRVVEVARLKKHPKYLKYYHISTKLKAHDPENTYHVGDHVIIGEVRPMSKEKRWIILGKSIQS
jgi:small subunit ribosomal protein S17